MPIAHVVAISDDTIVVAHHKLTILSLHAANNIGSLITVYVLGYNP